MSELQDALDAWDDIARKRQWEWAPLVDAARLVANPNYEAALASVFTRGGA